MKPPCDKKQKCLIIAVCIVVIILGLGFLLWVSWNGIAPGTCGPETIPLNYSMPIIPDFTLSYLHDFREPEPDLNLNLTGPPLHSYDERQDTIVAMMDRAHVNAPPDSVVGLYEYPGARLVLIDQNPGIVEILEAGENITVFPLSPSILGRRQYTINETRKFRQGDSHYSYTNTLSVEKVRPVPPDGENSIPLLYIVNKIDRERDTYPDGRLLVEITTRGTFFVTYGKRVERVTGNVSVTPGSGWNVCSSRLEKAGDGTGTGEVKSTVKIARSSDRMLRTRLIATSAHIQQYDVDMGSSDAWGSADSTGCSC